MTIPPLTPFLRFCLALHLLALVLLLRWPAHWDAVVLALLLLHGLIATIGLLPRSQWLGTNLTRLPDAAAQRKEIAITIDDGPDPEVTPAVLDILKQHGARATFFCIGTRAARHPDLCRRILAEGHQIENHGQRHPVLLALSGPRGWQREILDGRQTLQAVCGHSTGFYRPVAGLRNPFLAPCLEASGLILVSWTRRGYDTRDKNPDNVYSKLIRGLQAGDILLLHDGNAARDANGQPIIQQVLPRLLSALKAHDLHTVTLRQACQPPLARDLHALPLSLKPDASASHPTDPS
ncbi:polysaccharide deacetylase family protein [Paludibacterium sp. THUN1379]|uniref:polysaccharide deacetylase family protein n=1 Tax=Paludibacterium sp. THUN1379 TaxID=3112107 RepID=UPI0030881D19|nr:polysaccharide deacetylase family protein [Paludibacterium sp. THUN1379]